MSKNLGHILIDETHCTAICTEIGERLRPMLKNGPMPAKLAALLARFDEQEFHESPSIVPMVNAFEPA